MKIKWFNAGWFPVEYTLVTVQPQWKSIMDEMEVPMNFPSTPGSCTLFTTSNSSRVIITLDKDYFENSNPVHKNQIEATLVHECTHALDQIMDAVGEDNIGSELKAYGTEHIYRDMKQEAIRQEVLK